MAEHPNRSTTSQASDSDSGSVPAPRLVSAVLAALAFATLAGCGASHPAAGPASSPATASGTQAPGAPSAGLSTFSMLGVQFAAPPRFTAGAPDHHVDGSSTLTYTAPGGEAGLDPQIGIGAQPHQQQDADGATNLALQVFKYTAEKITANRTVQVPGAKGHGRLVDIDYLVKDASGQQHPTRLQALRFVATDGTGYEVFVRATTTDFDRYQLGQVLATARTATGSA